MFAVIRLGQIEKKEKKVRAGIGAPGDWVWKKLICDEMFGRPYFGVCGRGPGVGGALAGGGTEDMNATEGGGG